MAYAIQVQEHLGDDTAFREFSLNLERPLDAEEIVLSRGVQELMSFMGGGPPGPPGGG